MVQSQLPEHRLPTSVADTSRARGKGVESGTLVTSPSPHQSSSVPVSGPHSRVRTRLLWVNKLLAYDESNSVSVISVKDLEAALSRFQQEVRLLPLASGEGPEASSPSRSSIRTGPRSVSRSVKNRTRNFKA